MIPWLKSGQRLRRSGFLTLSVLTFSIGGLFVILPTRQDPQAVITESFNYTLEWYGYLQSTWPDIDLEGLSWFGVAPALWIVTTGLLSLCAIGFFLHASLRPTHYGDAAFGGAADIRRQELDGTAAAVLGKFGRHVLRPKEQRSTLVLAPTRRGKTAGIVIPTILDYPGTIVAISTKDELPRLTGAARRRIGPVYDVAFAEPDTPNAWSFSSLRQLPETSHELERHAARCAAAFFPEPKSGDPYWQRTARRLAQAFIHFEFLEAQREQRDGNIGLAFARLKSAQLEGEGEGDGRPSGDLVDTFRAACADIILRCNHFGYPERIAHQLDEWAKMDMKQRTQHFATISTGLDVLTYETVRNATSHSDFSFDDLRHRPSTVYIRFPLSDREAFGQLTSLFFDCLITYALDHNPANGYRTPVLLIMDEFSSIPAINSFPSLMTTGAGNSVTAMIVLQTISSLRKVYGQEQADEIATNCTYTVAFGQNEPETQDWLSKRVGDQTRWKKTTSGGFSAPIASTLTQATEAQRLIKPEWWGSIPFGRHIVMTDGHFDRPLYVDTPFWFQNTQWKSRVSK